MKPTTKMYLFDTSVLIEILKRNPVIEQKRQVITTGVYWNAIVLGELLLGAKKSTKAAQSIQDVQLLHSTITMLVLDATTADYYSSIKQSLQAIGQVIPENDIWMQRAPGNIN